MGIISYRSKILYDGDCKLCRWSTQIINDQDARGTFEFVPLQSDLEEDLLVRLGIEIDSLDSVLLIEESGFHTKSDAILRIVKQLPGKWSYLSWLSIVPSPIRDAVYDLIARNRFRWFGKRASSIPLAKDDLESGSD